MLSVTSPLFHDTKRLICRRELAAMLSVSLPTLDRLKSAGKLPRPVALGGCVRWRTADIDRWLCLNCPDRDTFEAILASENG
jgi:predicted DNA-binding transcriptional regulator AlpA